VFIDVLLDAVRGVATQHLFDQETGEVGNTSQQIPKGWASGRQRTLPLPLPLVPILA
jgi:hypothetical protein